MWYPGERNHAMNTKQLWIPIMGMLLCGEIARGAGWQAVAQPDLKEQLAKAPTLKPETLAAPARGVTSWTFQLIPNPDGKTDTLAA